MSEYVRENGYYKVRVADGATRRTTVGPMWSGGDTGWVNGGEFVDHDGALIPDSDDEVIVHVEPDHLSRAGWVGAAAVTLVKVQVVEVEAEIQNHAETVSNRTGHLLVDATFDVLEASENTLPSRSEFAKVYAILSTLVEEY